MVTKIKYVAASPVERIAELTERRNHLAELKDLVAAAPRSVAEAEADIPKTIEMLASRCEPQTAWLGQGPSGFADLARQLGQADVEYAAIPAAALMAWAAPELLSAALRRDLEASYSQLPAPMTSAAKHAELARLQGEIATVETAIAGAFWQATDSGLSLAVPDIDGGRLIGLPA